MGTPSEQVATGHGHRAPDAARLARMVEEMPVAVMTADPVDLRITYLNRACRRLMDQLADLLPIGIEDLVGSPTDVLGLGPQLRQALVAAAGEPPLRARLELGPEVLELRLSTVAADDGTPGDAGREDTRQTAMIVWERVTEQVETERRTLDLARRDALTGLANSAAFHEQMSAVLTATGGAAGVLFVDLDGFKSVNDTHGHHVGDDLITQVAERIRASCGYQEAVLGRLGGDEFGVLLPHADADLLALTAANVIAELSEPYRVDRGRLVRLGASVGIAIGPGHGSDGAALLERADIALYAAKAAGKGTHRLFTREMEEEIGRRDRLERDLRHALETGAGLFVFYQDVLDVQARQVTAREALVRWHHPELGWIPPTVFVPMAEEAGLADRLGRLVIGRACHDAAAWSDGARVAVGVSAAQLGTDSLFPTVIQALTDSALAPERLEVEVTETALLTDPAGNGLHLRRLRWLGVRVAIDGFGAGPASLGHLRDVMVDTVRIDGSLVRQAVRSPGAAAVVHAVAVAGRRLGLTVVAEGVETHAHLELVTREGCTAVQGPLLAPPAPSPRDAAAVAALGELDEHCC